MNFILFQMRPVPPGPVQRQRSLRPHRVPQAVPLRRGRGRGQPLLRPVRLQAERAGMRFNTLLKQSQKSTITTFQKDTMQKNLETGIGIQWRTDDIYTQKFCSVVVDLLLNFGNFL